MKRYRRTSIRWVALRIGIVALALLVGAIVANAQIDTILIFPRNLAVTVCSNDGGALSVVKMSVLDSAALLEEVVAHERTHREDIRRDPAICRPDTAKDSVGQIRELDAKWRAVLRTEVHAYCVSDSVAVRHGAKPLKKYLDSLVQIVNQFDDYFKKAEIVATFYDGCGRQLRQATP
jgi:hypothetical protein